MSIRSVGPRSLGAAPWAVPAGHTGASYSFWVQLNPGSSPPASDALLFGRTGDRLFEVVLPAGSMNLLRFRWNPTGGSGKVSVCDTPLNPGNAVHVASNYRAGSQEYFVNGSLVFTDTCPDPLLPLSGPGTAGAFQVGPGVAGPDVTVDEPTVWLDYRLTAADVTNLRDRLVHPEGVAPANTAWQVSLDGPAGASVALGDAALLDSGPFKLPVVALSTPPPSYVAGVLTFTPAARVNAARVAPSGESLLVDFLGRDGSPSPVTLMTYGAVQTVTVNGLAGTYTLSDNGHASSPLAPGRPASVVQAALEAVTGVGVGNVSVSGFGPYRVAFQGALANAARGPLVPAYASLGGALPAVPAGDATGSQVAVGPGTPGYALTGTGWLNRPTYPGTAGNGSYVPPGVGANYSAWTFSGLNAGKFVLEYFDYDRVGAATVLPANYSSASAARYRFYDGASPATATLRGTAVVSQGASSGWKPLSKVYCSSGTLTVLLADDPDSGGWPISTGVRLTPPGLTGVNPPEPSDAYPTPGVVAAVVNPGGPPSVKVNGGPSQALAAPFWFNYPADATRLQPYAVFPLPSTVRPGDAVTLTLPDGAVVTASGAVAGVTDGAVTNRAGGTVLARTPKVGRQMRMGMNVGTGVYYDPFPLYSNVAKTGNAAWTGVNPALFSTYSADGYPDATAWAAYLAAGHGGLLRQIVCASGSVYDARGYPMLASGTWTLKWDGAGDMRLFGGSGEYADDPAQRVTGQATNNRRVYTVPPDPGGHFSPYVECVYNGGVVSNHRVYPPGVDAANPTKFHPAALAKLAGSAFIRLMSFFQSNSSGIANYSDFSAQTEFNFTTRFPQPVVEVSSVGPYSGPFAADPNYLKVTTSAPHGFSTGTVVYGTTGAGDSTYPVNKAGGGTVNYDFTAAIGMVIDATSFMLVRPAGVAVLTTPIPSNTIHVYTTKGTAPPEDGVDLVNAVAGADCWFNVPPAATDACVTSLATLIAGRLAAGRKCIVEVGNEHWNYAYGFFCFPYWLALGKSLTPYGGPLSFTQAYTLRSAQVHKIFSGVFAAAGRGGDLVRYFGAFAANAGVATEILAYAAGHDSAGRRPSDPGYTSPIPVDWVGIAPYYNLYGGDSSIPAAVLDGMTLEQHMDAGDAQWLYGVNRESSSQTASNKAAVAASAYPSAKLVAYEAATQTLGIGGTLATADTKSIAASLHPRSGPWSLAEWAAQDALGLYAYGYFALCCGWTRENGVATDYGVYKGINILDGYGDGSDGKADNRPLIADGSGFAKLPDVTQTVSVVGQARRDWISAAAPAAPAAPKTRFVTRPTSRRPRAGR